jgi:hypothetical protein
VTEYLHESEHVTRRIWDVKKEEGIFGEVLEGALTKVLFSLILRDLTHDNVITNIEVMGPWIH